jgi:hypothetical protein
MGAKAGRPVTLSISPRDGPSNGTRERDAQWRGWLSLARGWRELQCNNPHQRSFGLSRFSDQAAASTSPVRRYFFRVNLHLSHLTTPQFRIQR